MMNSLLYFITIYFLFSLYTLNVYSFDSTLYTETEPGLQIYGLIPLPLKDLTILHMIKPINNSCIEPEVNFRILYPNGTTEVSKVDYPIPEFNFCVGPSGFL